MDKSIKIILLTSISVTSFSYMIYRNIKRNQIYDLLIDKINKNSIVNNKTVEEVLTGVFHNRINSNKNYAMLSEAEKRKSYEKLYNSISGLGTNEKELYSTLLNLKDKVAISELASFYQAKQKKSLFLTLKNSELNSYEFMEISRIINNKPDLRWVS